MSDGTVKCWGRNTNGQLGDGTTAQRLTPVSVIGLGGTAVAISGGTHHTCALLSGGTMKCWGENSFRQLADGTMTHRTTPVSVIGLGGTAVSIGANGNHTCALLSDGTMKCWGINDFGQLGRGTFGAFATPQSVIGLGGTATSIALGGGHTCAVMSDATAKCWGENTFGNLGDGTNTHRNTPVSVINIP